MQKYIIGIIDLLLQIPKRNRFAGNLKRSMESRCESLANFYITVGVQKIMQRTRTKALE